MQRCPYSSAETCSPTEASGSTGTALCQLRGEHRTEDPSHNGAQALVPRIQRRGCCLTPLTRGF